MAALCSEKLTSLFVCGKGSACHPQWVVTSVPEEASDLPAEDRPTDTWRLPAATSAWSARMAIEDVGPEVARCNSRLVALPRPVCPALSSVAVWTRSCSVGSTPTRRKTWTHHDRGAGCRPRLPPGSPPESQVCGTSARYQQRPFSAGTWGHE